MAWRKTIIRFNKNNWLSLLLHSLHIWKNESWCCLTLVCCQRQCRLSVWVWVEADKNVNYFGTNLTDSWLKKFKFIHKKQGARSSRLFTIEQHWLRVHDQTTGSVPKLTFTWKAHRLGLSLRVISYLVLKPNKPAVWKVISAHPWPTDPLQEPEWPSKIKVHLFIWWWILEHLPQLKQRLKKFFD